jgi:alpha-ketoglutarate-dependent taurine dioxygenase
MVLDFIPLITERSKVINSKIFDFTSIEEISSNFNFYKEIFIKNGLIVFRNAKLSHQEHIVFHKMLSKGFGAYIENNLNGYTEDHSRLTDDIKKNANDNGIILDWHIEHPHYTNPIVLGSWNMHKFTAQEESGKTYFVDTKVLFDIMPDNFKEFAKKCIIINPVGKSQGVEASHKLVDNHWITGDLVIRISHLSETGNNYQVLYTFDGNVPTKEEYNFYNNIMKWIQDQLSQNLSIRVVHKWRQGDIVVPDMYKMCHAVSGGFESKQREFKGIWSRQYEHNRNG